MHSQGLLTDIAFSIIGCGIISLIMKLIKQPLIIGYVIAGIILGPAIGFGIITDEANIEIISEIGLIFLLFIIGLEINLRDMISNGKNIIVLAFSQVIIGSIVSFFCLKFLIPVNLSFIELVYITFCLNLTSTLIVVKILKDKFETQTIAAKLTIGILIFQDFFAIIFLAFQKNFLNPEYSLLLKSLVSSLLLLATSFAFSKYFLSKIIHKYSSSLEFVIILSIAYCFLISTLANVLGLSKEMGALIAGVSIANSPYSEELVVRISSIRDFFVTLFFVSLGLKLPVVGAEYLTVSMILIVIIVVSRFISILFYYKILKLGVRPLFITSLNLIPISEFGLVITSLGVKYSHIGENVEIIILITMIISSLLSTYIINYNHIIYSFFSKIFSLSNIDERFSSDDEKTDILVLGYNKLTAEIIKTIKEKFPSISVEVADFNALNSKELNVIGVKWTYVDLSNYESLKRLEGLKPSLVISMMSDLILKGINTYNLMLNATSIFPESVPVSVAETYEEEQRLKSIGVRVINIATASSSMLIKEVEKIIKK
ncbi:MAG: potassium transporter Kef [Elusimicrobia bacterium]|nr:potassium transporter Kef [Elusimicrobiota bacterium]